MVAEGNRPDEYAALKQLIVAGAILPNERLVEQDYADRLQTNRANIRRAFSRLEQEGLIVSTPFRGVRVRMVSPEEAIEIFEIRAVVECLLMRPASERVAAKDQLALKKLMDRMNAAVLRHEPMVVGSISRQLREILWHVSGHQTGSKVLSSLNSQLVRIWYQSVLMPGRDEEIIAEMREVVAGICEHDAERATLAMRRYHDGAIQTLKKSLASRQSVAVSEFPASKRR